MRVELSVDSDFEAPSAAKELNEEVKVVRTWLIGSELFGAPQLLVEEARPGPTPSELVPTGDVATEVQPPIAGDAEDANVVLVGPQPFLVLWANDCIARGESAERLSEVIATSERIAEAFGHKAPPPSVLGGGGRDP
jgi:hypothetical protein